MLKYIYIQNIKFIIKPLSKLFVYIINDSKLLLLFVFLINIIFKKKILFKRQYLLEVSQTVRSSKN